MNSLHPNPVGGNIIPSRISTAIPWVMSFYANIINMPQLGISPQDLTTLEDLYNTFIDRNENFPTHPTKETRRNRNVALKGLLSFCRYLIQFYVRRPGVQVGLLARLGINEIDTIRTAHTVVRELVDFTFSPSLPLAVDITYWQRGIARSKAKPRGYDGAVFIWKIADEMPLTNEEYNDGHRIATRNPFRIEFEEVHRGQRIWFKSAWQNRRGILGEFSAALSTVIP